MTPAITNVVFDIGGVLADFRLMEFLAEKGFDAAMSRRIIKATVLSPYWGMFERSEIPEEETLRGFAAADPAISDELYQAFSNLSGMLVSRNESIPLIQALRQNGYGVYYLSNYSKKAFDECGESLAFMPYMDGGVVSFRAGMTKPDPRVYRRFLEQYGLQPESCVFVDDTEENVRAAEALGFWGIVFKSFENLSAQLEQLDVKI